MGKVNPYTQAVQNVVAEWRRVHKREATRIPFGFEEVGRDAARRRLALMSPDERTAMVQQFGIDAIIKLVQ